MAETLSRGDFLKIVGISSLVLTLVSCNKNLRKIKIENSATDSALSRPTFRIGHLPLTHAALPLIVNSQSQNGKFDHFDLEMVRFSNWAELAESIQAGWIDGAGCFLNNLAFVIVAKGVPLRSVLMAVRAGSALTVNKSIINPEDLSGKTIAIPSRFSPHYILLYQYLIDHGLDPTDINTLEIGPPEMVQALASGGVDGFIVAEPYNAQAEHFGIGKVLTFSKDMNIPGANNLECGITLRKDIIDLYPDAVQEFVDKMILAGIWIDENPNDAANLLGDLIGQDPSIIYQTLCVPPGRSSFVDLYPRLSEYEALQEYMLKLDLIDKKIDMTTFVESRFAENTYQKYGLNKQQW